MKVQASSNKNHTEIKNKENYSRHKTAVKINILPATQSTLGTGNKQPGAYFIISLFLTPKMLKFSECIRRKYRR